jgi:hypothetical protein
MIHYPDAVIVTEPAAFAKCDAKKWLEVGE